MTTKRAFPVRRLGLHEITVDPGVQSRVATDMEHQKTLSDSMLRGAVPDPVVVFQDGTSYVLADGFHRHGAFLSLFKSTDPGYHKFGDILAEIRPGGRREAMIFSAGANQITLLPRTSADIRNSVFMLMADAEWFNRSNREYVRHVGVGSQAIRKYRLEYLQHKKIRLHDWPAELAKLVRRKGPKLGHERVFFGAIPGQYCGYVGGQLVGFGKKQEEAQTQFENRLRAREAREELNQLDSGMTKGQINLGPGSLRTWLASKGISAIPLADHGERCTVPLSGLVAGGEIVLVADMSGQGRLFHHIGKAVFAREFYGAEKVVLICGRQSCDQSVLALCDRLGLEFLTPHEFADRLTRKMVESPGEAKR